MPPSVISGAAGPVVNYLNRFLATELNTCFGKGPPSTRIAYCEAKVFWFCNCESHARHLIFTSRKCLLDRCKQSPEAALRTMYCITVATDSTPSRHRRPTDLEARLIDGLNEVCGEALARFAAYVAEERKRAVEGPPGAASQARLSRIQLLEEGLAVVPASIANAGPHFVAEARSLPGRSKSSPDASILRPFGKSSPEDWPFGAVMQVDGHQHMQGKIYRKEAQQQRKIDEENDLDAWRNNMPVLRISYNNRSRLRAARCVFLLAALANPGQPFIMYTKGFYKTLNWDWALNVLKATKICHVARLGLFILSAARLELLEVDDSVPTPTPPPPSPPAHQQPHPQRQASPAASGQAAAAVLELGTTEAGHQGAPPVPSGLRPLQARKERKQPAPPSGAGAQPAPAVRIEEQPSADAGEEGELVAAVGGRQRTPTTGPEEALEAGVAAVNHLCLGPAHSSAHEGPTCTAASAHGDATLDAGDHPAAPGAVEAPAVQQRRVPYRFYALRPFIEGDSERHAAMLAARKGREDAGAQEEERAAAEAEAKRAMLGALQEVFSPHRRAHQSTPVRARAKRQGTTSPGAAGAQAGNGNVATPIGTSGRQPAVNASVEPPKVRRKVRLHRNSAADDGASPSGAATAAEAEAVADHPNGGVASGVVPEANTTPGMRRRHLRRLIDYTAAALATASTADTETDVVDAGDPSEFLASGIALEGNNTPRMRRRRLLCLEDDDAVVAVVEDAIAAGAAATPVERDADGGQKPIAGLVLAVDMEVEAVGPNNRSSSPVVGTNGEGDLSPVVCSRQVLPPVSTSAEQAVAATTAEADAGGGGSPRHGPASVAKEGTQAAAGGSSNASPVQKDSTLDPCCRGTRHTTFAALVAGGVTAETDGGGCPGGSPSDCGGEATPSMHRHRKQRAGPASAQFVEATSDEPEVDAGTVGGPKAGPMSMMAPEGQDAAPLKVPRRRTQRPKDAATAPSLAAASAEAQTGAGTGSGPNACTESVDVSVDEVVPVARNGSRKRPLCTSAVSEEGGCSIGI